MRKFNYTFLCWINIGPQCPPPASSVSHRAFLKSTVYLYLLLLLLLIRYFPVPLLLSDRFQTTSQSRFIVLWHRRLVSVEKLRGKIDTTAFPFLKNTTDIIKQLILAPTVEGILMRTFGFVGSCIRTNFLLITMVKPFEIILSARLFYISLILSSIKIVAIFHSSLNTKMENLQPQRRIFHSFDFLSTFNDSCLTSPAINNRNRGLLMIWKYCN